MYLLYVYVQAMIRRDNPPSEDALSLDKQMPLRRLACTGIDKLPDQALSRLHEVFIAWCDSPSPELRGPGDREDFG